MTLPVRASGAAGKPAGQGHQGAPVLALDAQANRAQTIDKVPVRDPIVTGSLSSYGR